MSCKAALYAANTAAQTVTEAETWLEQLRTKQ